MTIKILLVAAAVGIGWLLLREKAPGQRQALRRMAGVVVILAGIVAVLRPELTTWVANLLGVGRGTDLVLYLFVLVFTYSAVATAQRMHRLEQHISVLTRELALAQPAEPTKEAGPRAPAVPTGSPDAVRSGTGAA